MFGFLKTMFTSSPDKVMDMAKGVGSFIDESFYTEQEKAEGSLRLLDAQLKWLNATQGMNLARRYMMFMFCGSFVFTFLLCVYALAMGFAFSYDVSPFVDGVKELAMEFKIGWVTMTIVVFYFGKGILENRK